MSLPSFRERLESRAMELSGSVSKAITAKEDRAADADFDATIVERVQRGEVAAFDQLILKYRERLFAIIYNLTSNREDAADLTQDVFIKAFRAINRFKGKSSFFTWIYRIAVNTTYTHLRRNRVRRFFSFEVLDEELASSEILEALTSRSDVPKEELLRELQEKLNEALQSLSLNHRTVVILFEIESLSHQEIAEIMDCSIGTVRSRLHYAKQQLQAKLQPYLSI
ncbi:MAG TPA: sigma-70 family RNA polymerase sigma factor [Opitutales bacterium]|nr:sigma-70 family RNA polymerase sigma factor [Opitutales bacterium]